MRSLRFLGIRVNDVRTGEGRVVVKIPPTPSRELKHDDLVPGRKVRALADDVRRFVLKLGDGTDLYFYNGVDYRVRWKGCGLGMAEIWLEKRP